MFRREPLRLFRRAQCSNRPAQRAGPWGRATRPSDTALAMNSANSGTGSALRHSPAAQARYQPAEPPIASRTKARQSTRSTTQSNPGARPPSIRRVPSGKVASSEPCSNPWSIRSSMRWKSGANRRARHPGVRSAGGRRIDNAALPRRGSTAFIGPLSAPCRASLQSPLHLAIGRQRALATLAMADPLFGIG